MCIMNTTHKPERPGESARPLYIMTGESGFNRPIPEIHPAGLVTNYFL
jgi:hypothetical protein